MNIAWHRKPLSPNGHRPDEWPEWEDYRRDGFDCFHPSGETRELLTPLLRRSYRVEGRPRSKVVYRPAIGIRTCCLADTADPMPKIGFWWTFEHRLSEAPAAIAAMKDWMRTKIALRVPLLTRTEALLGSLFSVDGESFDGRRSRAERHREQVARARARVEAYLKTRRQGETPEGWKTRTYPPPNYNYVNFGVNAASDPGSPAQREADCRVLGLTWPFTLHDAKKVYRAAVMTRHPDRGGTQAAFIELQAAYERLVRIIGASDAADAADAAPRYW